MLLRTDESSRKPLDRTARIPRRRADAVRRGRDQSKGGAQADLPGGRQPGRQRRARAARTILADEAELARLGAAGAHLVTRAAAHVSRTCVRAAEGRAQQAGAAARAVGVEVARPPGVRSELAPAGV